MDQNALDVRGRRWPGHEYTVAGIKLRALAVSVVQVAHDARRIEQHHQVLGEKAEAVHLELAFGEPYRAGLGDPVHGAHHTDVDVAELRRASHRIERPAARHLRRRRADDLGLREQRSDEEAEIALRRRSRDLAAHAGERGLEALHLGARGGIEARHGGQRSWRRLVVADPTQDLVAAAHGLLRFFRYHWRNVCGAAAGTSR